MARKITIKGLARATEEYLDAQAKLDVESYRMSVQPETAKFANDKKKKLDTMLKAINMEAKDGISRRSSSKK